MVGFVALCDLYRIAGRVCRQIYGIDSFREHLEPQKIQDLREQAENLDAELLEWCNQLPTTFKSAPTNDAQVTMGAVLCSHYYSVLTTLHRNFLPLKNGQFTGIASSMKAVNTARSCIRLAPSVKNVVPSSHHLAFFIQHLFSSAVIILLYAMHISDRDTASAAMAEAENCMGVVTAWEGTWPGARKCRELLSDLANTAKEAINKGPVVSRSQEASPFGGPISPSSPTQQSNLQRSLSGRMFRSKHPRATSRDARERIRRRSLSLQGSRLSGPSGLGSPLCYFILSCSNGHKIKLEEPCLRNAGMMRWTQTKVDYSPPPLIPTINLLRQHLRRVISNSHSPAAHGKGEMAAVTAKSHSPRILLSSDPLSPRWATPAP